MRILVTGSKGFIGRNLVVRLRELEHQCLEFGRGDSLDGLDRLVAGADAVIHLAGENRPQDPVQFECVNVALTERVCAAIARSGRKLPLIFASTTQAVKDNPYGRSKRAAEAAIERFVSETGNKASIYRLPGVFGKWSRPNYNSVVATFCSNIANDLSISISDPSMDLPLVYVDDVISCFFDELSRMQEGLNWPSVEPEYVVTLGELAELVMAFRNSRNNLVTERVGEGFVRALYSTYVSFLPSGQFIYDLSFYADQRGVFVEMLKTKDSGQFSYFTAHPGVTRGGHYHHSKTEKFLVLKGEAVFRFRNILTNERHRIRTSGARPQVVETIPGWAHDITNVGAEDMIVMLWVNEIFDRNKPDTISSEV
tara:strand:- start:152 stop:1255 length:1104 start_codon:yes stop_codon:yes gene_type:complete